MKREIQLTLGWWKRMSNLIVTDDDVENVVSSLEEDNDRWGLFSNEGNELGLFTHVTESEVPNLVRSILEMYVEFIQDTFEPVQLTVCYCGASITPYDVDKGYCSGCTASISIQIRKDEL